MGKNPLFSTYRQGENRVTSSMMAVFERVDVGLLEQILAAATGEASLQMVTFVNQPAGAGASVPDALIQARFAYWFEVKTVANALRRNQLDEHIANLDGDVADERLFVVTPDATEPAVIAEIDDTRVVWFNFRAISEAITTTLADPALLPGERTVFLLRELQALFLEDGLVDGDDTVIVAARFAYGEYLDHGAYICQPRRSFRRRLAHLGFYCKGSIQREVPKILGIYDDVPFTQVEADRRSASPDEAEQGIGRACPQWVPIEQTIRGEARNELGRPARTDPTMRNQRHGVDPTPACAWRAIPTVTGVQHRCISDATRHYEQPLVAPQDGQAWQEPARCMMSPQT